MRWLKQLFSSKDYRKTCYDTLKSAMHDVANDDLSLQATSFFENPEAFSEYMYSDHDETSYDADERRPSYPELAFEIFYNLLRRNGYTRQIDWASGPDDIIEEYDAIFAKNDMLSITLEEKKKIHDLTNGLKRGESYMKLWSTLEQICNDRSMKLQHFALGHDAHYPIVLTPEAYKKWRHEKFDRDFHLFYRS